MRAGSRGLGAHPRGVPVPESTVTAGARCCAPAGVTAWAWGPLQTVSPGLVTPAEGSGLCWRVGTEAQALGVLGDVVELCEGFVVFGEAGDVA